MDKFQDLKCYEDVDSWETLMFLYNAALKEISTKIEILNDEFQHVHHYTPIEHIKSRIKTPESIVKKLKKYGYEVNVTKHHIAQADGEVVVLTDENFDLMPGGTEEGPQTLVQLNYMDKYMQQPGWMVDLGLTGFTPDDSGILGINFFFCRDVWFVCDVVPCHA